MIIWDKERNGRSVRYPGRWEVHLYPIKAYYVRLALSFGWLEERDRPWYFHFAVLWLSVFIHIPWIKHTPDRGDEFAPSWGFSAHFFDETPCIHINRGKNSTLYDLPWTKVHQRHEVRRPDGTWVPFVGEWDIHRNPQLQPDGREVFDNLSYRYVLKSGEVQHRTARVFVDRRAWRPKWFQWTSLFERVSTSIDVWFSDEVGERAGSWKGGTLGCGYEMRPGETWDQCYRRMERERKFD